MLTYEEQETIVHPRKEENCTYISSEVLSSHLAKEMLSLKPGVTKIFAEAYLALTVCHLIVVKRGLHFL